MEETTVNYHIGETIRYQKYLDPGEADSDYINIYCYIKVAWTDRRWCRIEECKVVENWVTLYNTSNKRMFSVRNKMLKRNYIDYNKHNCKILLIEKNC